MRGYEGTMYPIIRYVILGFWGVVLTVYVLGKYMIIRYFDLQGRRDCSLPFAFVRVAHLACVGLEEMVLGPLSLPA